jgi:hypothetical protein
MVVAVVVLGAGAAGASAAERWVAASGSDIANDCAVQATPCATIAHAVGQASDGDTIEIGPGTYDEAIATSADLTFAGSGASGANETLIDSTGQHAPALELDAGGSVSDLAVTTSDDGIAGALDAGGGSVTAHDIAATGDGVDNGSDAIDVLGGSFSMSDSTAGAVNTDADVEDGWQSGDLVVFDGSGVEVSGGQATITRSTLTSVEGIALRVHGSTTSATVSDSLIESSGTEDIPVAQTGSAADGWQAIEAAAGPLTLTGDTVYNATVGGSDDSQPPADAVTAEAATGVSVASTNSILLAQPGGAGSDIDTVGPPVAADHSSFTTTTATGDGTITAVDTAGNVYGDPQLTDPPTGDFSLAAGSPLVGAADTSSVQTSETDLSGAPRATTCAGGSDVANIGALESVAPSCPAAAPVLTPGTTSYTYVANGFTATGAYEQFMGSDLLTRLSPFEADAVRQASGFIAGADASQIYTDEGGTLQQYAIDPGGQLTPGTAIAPPAGTTFDGVALGANGDDLYAAVRSGSGASASIVIDHERVGAGGAVTLDGSTPVQAGSTGASLGIDQTGRVYALASHVDGTATLFDFRPDADGSLTQEDSLALAQSGSPIVSPAANEVVLESELSAGDGTGMLTPIGVGTGGRLTAASAVKSGSQLAGHGTDNNPTGGRFSPDGTTLYVANEDVAGVFSGLEVLGSMIAPFHVETDGSLTPETPTPDPGTAGTFPNALDYAAGLAASASGATLYVPDNDDPASGNIDELHTATGGVLTTAAGSPAAGEPDQLAIAVVTPPGGLTAPPGGPGGGTTVTLEPPPPPAATSNVQGISGTVTNRATGAAVPGAGVSACPPGGQSTSACATATTDAGGHYTLGVSAGTWLVMVSPPGNLLDGRITVTVTVGREQTQDFALAPPTGLSGGLAIDGVTSGVLTFPNTQPISLRVPLPIPGDGTPNTTRLFIGFAGDATSQATGGAGFQAAQIIFAARYGPDGHIAAISNPALAPVDCGMSAAQTQACTALSQVSSFGPAATTRGAHPREVPTPHFRDEVVSDKIVPNDAGGITETTTFSDGTTQTLYLPQAQIPTPPPGGDPWPGEAVNIVNAGVNTYGPLGWWNAVVGGANSLAQAQNTSGAGAATNYASAGFQVLAQAVGSKYHGGVSLFWNLGSGLVNGSVINPDGPAVINFITGSGGSASAYADPSGTVSTKSGIPISGATVTLRRAASATAAQQAVPKGSVVMSPANRRNPDRTDALGDYGWDVLPGFYRIDVTHKGCTAVLGSTASSKVLPVPPAQTGVNLQMTCPHLRRTAVRLRLTIGRAGGKTSSRLVSAKLSGAGHPQGTVAFTAGRKKLDVVLVDPKTGAALLSLPAAAHVKGTLSAAYSGDGTHKPVRRRAQL